jgi:glutamyl-tRNA reductase
MEADPTERRSPPPPGRDDADPEAVRAAIRARARGIEQSELREAFDRLEARGTLTPEQRRIIRRMAAAIVDGVLGAPESVLGDVTEQDRETVRVAIGLFDPER